MRVFAAPFKGTQPNASVLIAVELDGAALPFRENDGVFENKLDLLVVAVDQRGQSRDGRPNTYELKLRPATRQAVAERGLRVTERLNVPPGRYQLRVGAFEQNEGAVGTITYDLIVPDFHKASFEMSGVVLTARSAGFVPTAAPDAELQELLEGPPTADREFERGDILRAFAEVYSARGGQPHKIDITSTVRLEGGPSVFTHSEERGTDELQGGRGGFGYRVDIPLQFEPGMYVLTVEARSRLSGSPSVRRDIPFRVTGRSEPRAAVSQIETIDRGMMSAIAEPRHTVVRSEAEWQALWKAHAPTRPVPPVDFASRTVVAVFVGSRSTAGYDVALTRFERDGDGVRIFYRETRPAAGEMTVQVITSPFHIAALPAFAGPATFHPDER